MKKFPIRKEVRKLKGYRLEHQYGRIKLNQNESPYDLPEPLKRKALEKMKEAAWNRYPTPFCDPLRNKIAEREGWDPRGVVVSGGSNILIQAIVIASSVRGKILTVTPGFSLYEIEGRLLANRVIQAPLHQEDFSLPLELFLTSLRKAKPDIVFLANPNAPTGNLIPEEDLVAILKSAEKVGALVVIDEAYYPFSGVTMAAHLRKFSHLVIIRTLSKAFSLGGVRLGYLLAAPEVAAEVMKVVLPFHVGVLTQAVGEVVLEEDGYVGRLVEEILAGREFLTQGLKAVPGLKVTPSHTNYVLFQTPRAAEIFRGLAERGILIRDVSGKRLPNALRVTVGTKDENKAFLEAMRELLRFLPAK